MSTNSAVAFDTLDYTNKLMKAGFTREQAEAQTTTQTVILNSLLANQIATKQDIKRIDYAIERIHLRIDRLELELNKKIDKLFFKLIAIMGSITVTGFTILGVLITL